MSFLAVILANLLRRPTRSLLTVAGIAVGIAAVVTLASIAWGFETAWTAVYRERRTDLIVVKSGSLSPVAPSFPADTAATLRTLPFVSTTSGMLSDVKGVEQAPIVLVFGWESKTFVWEHVRLVSGRWPQDDAEGAVVLGTVAAEMLDKHVGSTIQIETMRFLVCGILESPAFAENGAVVMTLPQLQRVTRQPGQVNFINVRVAPGATSAQVAELRRAVGERLPGFKAITANEVAANNVALRSVRGMSWATSGIALVVGAVGVMNTVLMSVFERVQEFGILLAVGWRRRRILRMILCESILLSLAGGAIGMLVGTVAVKALEVTPLLRGKVQGELSLTLYGVALSVSLGLGVLGGLYPAYRGSQLRPSDALRHE